ncbi:hypothetical protein [Mucilaginibacter glaciei]|uniref:Chromosomal replication initiator DnaA C-terminal domain-containing protein n=1 Tax=Mucilaginibacter glaciei TaxID=2772109 RepID=A0A926NQS8_9SPHI|nr:hypothetical protein [Mucilaginibacter glaciei]MBD1394291.1 hypothetical protein [Mucilaginibacter glaciei]
MTIEETIILVKAVTGVQVDQLKRKEAEYPTFARLIAIVLMDEENYANTAIATALTLTRSHTHRALNRASELLITNKQFKRMYLSCIEAMTRLEESK